MSQTYYLRCHSLAAVEASTAIISGVGILLELEAMLLKFKLMKDYK